MGRQLGSDARVKKTNRIRLLVQALWTALTNGYLYGFINGRIYTGRAKVLCVPGLNCYSCPGAFGSCPIGSLQAVLDSRNFTFSCYVFGTLMVFGSVFGRFICGWLCPFGLVQDLLYRIPLFKKVRTIPGDRWLRYLKYVVLVLFVIILPSVVVNFTGAGEPWFCKYICPSGTLMGGIPLLLTNPDLRAALGGLFTWKASLMVGILLLSIKVQRPFCRYLCPLGATYGLFNPIALYRLKVNEDTCITCKKCQSVCPMNIEVWKKPNSMECIRCGACRSGCPTGAISNKFWGC